MEMFEVKSFKKGQSLIELIFGKESISCTVSERILGVRNDLLFGF